MNYNSVSVLRMNIGGCDGTKKLQKLLDEQADHPYFIISDIQHIVHNGTSEAWIYYHGNLPKENEE